MKMIVSLIISLMANTALGAVFTPRDLISVTTAIDQAVKPKDKDLNITKLVMKEIVKFSSDPTKLDFVETTLMLIDIYKQRCDGGRPVPKDEAILKALRKIWGDYVKKLPRVRIDNKGNPDALP